jgi:phage baseplate assembly protein gpV
MNRTSHLLPQPRELPVGDTLHGLLMARVISTDPATYTAQVEVEEGSQSIEAAIMALRAFDGRGWNWLPEENELVVLGFLGGAKTRPVILGSLFARLDTIPNTEEGSVTLHHRSGTVLTIDASGDIHLTHESGSDETIDASNHTITHHGTTAQFQSNGDVVVTHANGQMVTLTGTKAEIDSANGGSKLTVDNSLAKLESGGSSVEVDNAGAINIFPAPGQIVNLGTGGTNFAVRDGDFTGPASAGTPHTHQVFASGGIVIIGG